MLLRCVGGLRQAWPCGGSSRVVGLADYAVSDGLGLARRNSLRVSGETLRSNSRRESVTKRATRAQPHAATHSHPGKSPPQGQACRSQPRWLRATVGVPTVLRPRRASQGSGAPLRGAEKRRCRGLRAQRASSSYLRRLFERSSQSERSEFRRMATASSIAGKPLLCRGRLAPSAGAWAGPSWLANQLQAHQQQSKWNG